MKSDIEIAKMIRRKIAGTVLAQSVTGKLTDSGRPNGSDKEDIVVAVLSNEGAGQIQQAYVNVNIYVKDLWNAETKGWEKHKKRLGELCELSKFLFTVRGEGWHTVPRECSQKLFPLGVCFEDGHTEHFINNKLYVEINNE